MHRLYDYGPSLNCWKVRELFRRLRRELELVPVSIFEGEGQSDAFLAMNPTGSVPVLELASAPAPPLRVSLPLPPTKKSLLSPPDSLSLPSPPFELIIAITAIQRVIVGRSSQKIVAV